MTTTPTEGPHTSGGGDAPSPRASDDRRGLLTRRRVLLGAAGAAGAGLVGWALVGRDSDDGGTASAPTSGPAPTSTEAPTTTATPPPTTTAPAVPTFDVRDHGARGDGTTDDTAAVVATFHAALTESRRLNFGVDPAVAATAPTVSFPVGSYACPTLAEVTLDAPLAIRGATGATIDVGTGRGDVTMWRCRSAIDVEGLEMLGEGTWLDLAGLEHDVALIRVAGCSFRGARAPTNAWTDGAALAHGPDRLVIEDCVVEGDGGRDPERFTTGFGLQIQRWGEAVVRGNTVTGVFQHALRIGHQEVEGGRPYSDRATLTVTGNTITGVWGSDKANGIIVGADDVRISGNRLRDVTSGRDEVTGVGDTEGIYVKGHGLTISDNDLVDAGRAQAQITVKGSDALVEGNRVEVTGGALTGGIRVENLNTRILGNEVIGIQPGQDAISVQDDPADDTIVVTGNIIRGGRPKHAIYVGRRAHVEITGNQVVDAPAERGAIHVRTLGKGTVFDVLVRDNRVSGAAGSDAVVLTARDDTGAIGTVAVEDNEFVDVGRAVRAVAYKGGTIGSVTLEGNGYDAVTTPVEASEGVPVTRVAGG